jgi:hypothetical protein
MYCIDERLIAEQAALVATRRDARWRMQRTCDELELRVLAQIVHDCSDAIEAAFPTDHWWWYQQLNQKQEQL